MHHALYSLLALPLAATALNLARDEATQPDKIIRYPITVATKGGDSTTTLAKRQSEAPVKAQQSGFLYTVDLEIGTPPQKVTVSFDTGSSELWVNPVCAKASNPSFCQSFGRYTESQTFVNTSTSGNVEYGTGYADFGYGYDYVQIGSARISQQVFGVATDTQFESVGILGAGPSLSGWDSPYPYVIDNMAKQKLINSRAFSLDLRSIGSDRGAVIYGGIDTRKFSGHLQKLPIIPAELSPDLNTRYWVHMDGITIITENGTEVTAYDQPNGQPVLLDSGYTISALPGPIFFNIVSAFPSAHRQEDSNEYVVDCDVAKTNGTVNFKFGSTVVNVPYADFIWNVANQGICKLGVIQDDLFPVLGDSFLRAAYVVYDWDNKNIHVANNEDCGSHLVPIGSGPNAVPSVAGECGASAPTTTASTRAPTATTAKTSVRATSAHPSHSKASTFTSTILTTHVHTITSCAPTVTKCHPGQTTIQTLTSYRTYCPEESRSTSSTVPTTATVSTTPAVSTVAAATPTTPVTQASGPGTTATYTIKQTLTCPITNRACGTAKVTTEVITVSPISTHATPISVYQPPVVIAPRTTAEAAPAKFAAMGVPTTLNTAAPSSGTGTGTGTSGPVPTGTNSPPFVNGAAGVFAGTGFAPFASLFILALAMAF